MGAGATVVDVLVVVLDDVVEGVGRVGAGARAATTEAWTGVGRRARAMLALTPAVAMTRTATTEQRTRSIDKRFTPGLTMRSVASLRHSSVTAVEGLWRWLRPTSGVGLALSLPVWATAVPPATGEVDELVVARARRGDQDAFASIVGHYDHRLRALAFRLLGDRDRMDDVLQEVYVKAFRSLPRFKGDAALGTWLYRITYNACLDDLRRRPKLAAGDLDDQLADPAAGPADIAVRRSDLAAALDRLPPDQRTAVLLVDAYGLDYADAAEVLGVRVGTIGSRLSRARTVLRAALEES